ncbi:MAG TPA: type VII secretion protein EccB [Mycobacterium sp.]|nr:type VII secretion protein EccB [Mycobacterium sp.]
MTSRQPDEFDDDRRSFASRTPVNDNPDQVVYRRGFVTRHQVSGWRFVMRRIASGVALHDTRMLVEPLRTQARAVLMGLLVLVTVAAGCFAFTLIWPSGAAGNDPVLADKSTSALYVRLGDQLHPVLNLTSARLIIGRPVNPTVVKSAALDKFPRGNLIGIPGAPERMVQNTTRDADWTVCEAVTGPAAGVTVIAGPPEAGGARAGALDSQQAALVGRGDSAWLLWEGRRSRIDLTDRAITGALGLGGDVPAPRSISSGLFNAIPEAPALTAPVIPDAGGPPRFDLPVPAPIGAVVESHALDGASTSGMLYYAVLPDGLQPISAVAAAVLRNTNSYGLDQPPRLGADQVAKLPVSRALDTSRYPEHPISLTDPVRDPITCAHWTKPAGASTGQLTLLSGSALPLPASVRTLDLVGAGAGGTASRVALAPGTGYFVQSVAGQSAAGATGSAGSLFWVSDVGVRYGLDTETDTGIGGGQPKTVTALGLQQPALEIPWSVLSLLAPGPTLSRADALLAHDGLAPDQRPGRRAVTASGGETR